APMPVENQVAIIYALTNGYLDDVSVEQIKIWERDFHIFLRTQRPEILRDIVEKRDLTEENEQALVAAIKLYKELFASPESPVGTEDYAKSAILQETEADRRMSEDQLRLAARPEAGAASARQSS